MEDAVDAGHGIFHDLHVTDVSLDELDRRAAVDEILPTTGREVVQDANPVSTIFAQRIHEIGADEAGSTGDKNCFFGHVNPIGGERTRSNCSGLLAARSRSPGLGPCSALGLGGRRFHVQEAKYTHD